MPPFRAAEACEVFISRELSSWLSCGREREVGFPPKLKFARQRCGRAMTHTQKDSLNKEKTPHRLKGVGLGKVFGEGIIIFLGESVSYQRRPSSRSIWNARDVTMLSKARNRSSSFWYRVCILAKRRL